MGSGASATSSCGRRRVDAASLGGPDYPSATSELLHEFPASYFPITSPRRRRGADQSVRAIAGTATRRVFRPAPALRSGADTVGQRRRASTTAAAAASVGRAALLPEGQVSGSSAVLGLAALGRRAGPDRRGSAPSGARWRALVETEPQGEAVPLLASRRRTPPSPHGGRTAMLGAPATGAASRSRHRPSPRRRCPRPRGSRDPNLGQVDVVEPARGAPDRPLRRPPDRARSESSGLVSLTGDRPVSMADRPASAPPGSIGQPGAPLRLGHRRPGTRGLAGGAQ